jgi:hypothetical protein
LAEQQLAAQPEPLRAFVVVAMDRLAQQPAMLSHPSAMIARGLMAEFRYDREGAAVWVTIVFLYGPDEQTLHVEQITVEYAG